MLKIFVTGDQHIGLKYAGHEQAEVFISKRMEAFSQMVRMANQEKCGLFVMTGDLFENTHSVSKRDVKILMERLSEFEGIVAVLPGNHDYYDPQARVWQYFEELQRMADRVVLLREYRPYPMTVNGENVILYPALCTSKHSQAGENHLGWMKKLTIPKDSAYHIGIAHGAVEGETIDREGRYFLMKRSELESIPMDVWLLGHTHVPFPGNLTEEYAVCDKILNPGTHVQTDVACNTEGQCFIVKISEDKVVQAKKFVSGNLRFYRKNIALTAGSIVEALEKELSHVSDQSVVDLILTGAVSAEEYENRKQNIEQVLSRFIEGTYRDGALSKLISKELIDEEFPETSLSAGFLTALLEEPKEAQLAYELLKSLKEGK